MKQSQDLDYFSGCMNITLSNVDEAFFGEKGADEQLLIATGSAMRKKLSLARGKGRHGWWNSDVCSISDLYRMREKALAENDHISVLNFTAMIAMRESIQD